MLQSKLNLRFLFITKVFLLIRFSSKGGEDPLSTVEEHWVTRPCVASGETLENDASWPEDYQICYQLFQKSMSTTSDTKAFFFIQQKIILSGNVLYFWTTIEYFYEVIVSVSVSHLITLL